MDRPDLAALVRYLSIRPSSDDIDNVAQNVSRLPLLPNLQAIISAEDAYPQRELTYLKPYAGQNVTHLLYSNGSVHYLGALMSVLPRLEVLHVGNLFYTRHADVPDDMKIVCRLKKMTVHGASAPIPHRSLPLALRVFSGLSGPCGAPHSRTIERITQLSDPIHCW